MFVPARFRAGTIFHTSRPEGEFIRRDLKIPHVIASSKRGLVLFAVIIPVVQPGSGHAAYSSEIRACTIELWECRVRPEGFRSKNKEAPSEI